MPPPTLFATPTSRQYRSAELSRLTRHLEARMASALVEELGDPAELSLDADGRMPGGYRFGEYAFGQVCGVLCEGLARLARDLAGVSRGPGSLREEYDFEDARRAYNRTLRLRFGRLAGRYRVLRDIKNRTVDGLLGPGFQPLDNLDLLERLSEAAAAMARPVSFSWASLTGRHLVVRFAAASPLFVHDVGGDGPEVFRSGLHAVNSEVGGESSFRVAIPLIRDLDGSASLGRFLGGRKTHTGRYMAKKVASTLADAAASEPDPARLVAGMRRMADRPVDIGGRSDDGRDERRARLVSRLADARVGVIVARRAIEDAAAGRGAFGSGDGARSTLDIYLALTAAALPLFISRRERAEQAAWSLLTGRLKLD